MLAFVTAPLRTREHGGCRAVARPPNPGPGKLATRPRSFSAAGVCRKSWQPELRPQVVHGGGWFVRRRERLDPPVHSDGSSPPAIARHFSYKIDTTIILASLARISRRTDLIQFRPTSIESGDLGFRCGVFGNEGGCFLGASDVESGFVQSLLQLRHPRLGGQDGGFHPFQFALLLEAQLAWTRRLGCNRDWFGDPHRHPLVLL